MNNTLSTRDITPIVVFLIVAALIPSISAVAILCLATEAGTPILLILQGVESAGPAIAAIVTVMFTGGRRGVTRFLAEKYLAPYRFRVAIAAFFAPLTLLALAKVLSMITTPSAVILQFPGAKRALIIAWALIAEELGWRGFLQERIERLASAHLTPLIVGVVWGIWHFHYFLTGAMVVPFWALIMGCVFESYGYYIVTKMAKGNIIPSSIWHFSGNLFINVFALNFDANGSGSVPYITANFASILCVIAFAVFSFKNRKEHRRKKGVQ